MSQTVDWQVYYDAAQKCHDLAGEIRQADAPLHAVLKNDCAGMAGDAPGCREWAGAYDGVANDTLQTCTNTADALTNLGYVLSAFGYNHGIANRSNPAPPRPTVEQVDVYRVSLPTAVGDNGLGTSRDDNDSEGIFDLFADKIVEAFGKLPNGSIPELAKAATGWQTFAEHTTLSGAAAQVATIRASFDNITDPNLGPILDGLDTLRTSTEQLASTSLKISEQVSAYHEATAAVRNQISSDVQVAAVALTATVVAAAATAFFTFGASAVAGAGGATALIANTVNTIRTVYQTSNLIKIVGLGAATATALVTVAAFEDIPSLTEVGTGLAAIIGMRVFLDDDGDINPGSPSGTFTSASMTTKVGKIANHYGVPPAQVRDAIHEVKRYGDWRGDGGNKNPDVVVDLESGEVYVKMPNGQPSEDSIGNIRDYLED
ncbi:hypothetical protein [Nocardia asteroides]|uniref:hypothetical protein n=1 Tax=Nocardia asteroides TaxID=1824 RepID=UPI001E5515FD|nr:hypothetical protein [Nocardia asteroides]UGT64184.1 hypothetical protein LTT61_13185 [Nocardia asteroides]